MFPQKSRLSAIARIALIAMLWQLLWPLSNAMAAQQGLPGETPICTASGIKWIKVGEQAPDERSESRPHCPLCVLGQGDAPIVVDSHSIVIPASPAIEARPLLNPPVLLSLAQAAPPPARGPPSNS
ncbi:MAG TPA: DUF2946 family protein [Burkholderiales bacterium]|nr:DUF2946 family protein [Burkholderiales bacterium]